MWQGDLHFIGVGKGFNLPRKQEEENESTYWWSCEVLDLQPQTFNGSQK